MKTFMAAASEFLRAFVRKFQSPPTLAYLFTPCGLLEEFSKAFHFLPQKIHLDAMTEGSFQKKTGIISNSFIVLWKIKSYR